MADRSTMPSTLLSLTDEPGGDQVVEPWIGSFIALGSLLRRFLPKLDGRQLILAVSVPRRDYVAALIGSGWMLSTNPPVLEDPVVVFKVATSSTYLRGVTDQLIVTGRFMRLEPHEDGMRVLTGGKLIPVDRYRAVSTVAHPVDHTSTDVPDGGSLAKLTGASRTWLERLAAPPLDLAIVGTKKWLQEDLKTLVDSAAAGAASGTALGTYVLPEYDGAATWSTPIISAARLGEGWELPKTCTAVILDRYEAIKYLNEITVPIVVCIVDRSVLDQSAAETITGLRQSNSRPVPVVDELHWTPPTGVEALAFTVAQ